MKNERIEYLQLQMSIHMDRDVHGTGRDVYVNNDREMVYDIEMQVGNTKELPKRSRRTPMLGKWKKPCTKPRKTGNGGMGI